MGIKNLSTFLRKVCPEVYQDVSFRDLAFKKIAIDVSIFLCRFKTTSEDWIQPFVTLITILRKNDIHPIFCFDNKAPAEKQQTRESRGRQQDKLKLKYQTLVDDFETYAQTGVVSGPLQRLSDGAAADTNTTHTSFLDFGDAESTSSASATSADDSRSTRCFDAEYVRYKITRVGLQIIKITAADNQLLKSVFTTLGVPYVVGAVEAETTCCDLCKLGLADAVMSEDSDVMVYDENVWFLCKVQLNTETCKSVKTLNILRALLPLLTDRWCVADVVADACRQHIPMQMFQELCIAAGTDYNTNIPRVGIFKVWSQMLLFITKDAFDQHGSNDDDGFSFLTYMANRGSTLVTREHLDTHVNQCRVLDIFTRYPDTPDCELAKAAYSKVPDLNVVHERLLIENINPRYIDLDSLTKSGNIQFEITALKRNIGDQ
jgi:5'-3' exonuclease